MKKTKRSLPFTLLLPLLSALPSSGIAQDPDPPAPPVEADEIGKTRNVHRSGSVWFAGQFTAMDIARIKERGIQRVITTRQDGEVDWDEKAQVEAAGLEWISVPFREPDTLTDEVFGRIRELLDGNETPTLVHCGSANRVGGVWLPYRVLDQGVALEQAREEAKTIGLRTPEYEERALAYIERQRGREDGVKKGINDSFKDPDLDVDNFIQRFEVESREVFAAREQIVNALALQPGMVVADVGAGTGLFSLPLATAVGSEGWVFAVDIAPRFLLHILNRASEAGVQNLSPCCARRARSDCPPHRWIWSLSVTPTITSNTPNPLWLRCAGP